MTSISYRRGFTLMEVMIVIAIVAILSALAYPSYQESIRKSRRAEGRAALMQLMQQQERYYSQNTKYIVFSSSSTAADEKKFKWYSGEAATASAYEVSAGACDGETLQTCVILTAKPGTDKVNASYTDALCGSLSLTSSGAKSSDGKDCW